MNISGGFLFNVFFSASFGVDYTNNNGSALYVAKHKKVDTFCVSQKKICMMSEQHAALTVFKTFSSFVDCTMGCTIVFSKEEIHESSEKSL